MYPARQCWDSSLHSSRHTLWNKEQFLRGMLARLWRSSASRTRTGPWCRGMQPVYGTDGYTGLWLSNFVQEAVSSVAAVQWLCLTQSGHALTGEENSKQKIHKCCYWPVCVRPPFITARYSISTFDCGNPQILFSCQKTKESRKYRSCTGTK